MTLLQLIAEAVTRDPGWPGFTGTVCIGLAGAEGIRWLEARLAGQATVTFEVADPAKADAALLFSEADAEAILARDEKPLESMRVFGDQRLLGKFLGRYLQRANVLGIRLATTQ